MSVVAVAIATRTIKVDQGIVEDEIALATVVITVQTWKQMIFGAMAMMEPAFVVAAAVVVVVAAAVVAVVANGD